VGARLAGRVRRRPRARPRTRAGDRGGNADAAAIRGARLLIAHLDGQEVDAGTAAEVGYGAALGLPCLALRSDLRASGEPGMHVNLQLEAFVMLSGGFLAGSLADLVARLAELRAA
jgi:nucleoside 2-deoxyribosyltransferase